MPVTITIPELTLPDAFPLLTAVQKRWDQDELARLGEQLAGVRLEDEGLWHTGRSDRHLLEVYAASRSFRLTRHDGDNELDGAADVGVGPDKASQIAEDFLALSARMAVTWCQKHRGLDRPGQPRARRAPRAVRHDRRPPDIVRGDIAFVGPGAKARVSVRPDGEGAGIPHVARRRGGRRAARAPSTRLPRPSVGTDLPGPDGRHGASDRVGTVGARCRPPRSRTFSTRRSSCAARSRPSQPTSASARVSAVEPRRLAKARRAGRAEVPAVLVA